MASHKQALAVRKIKEIWYQQDYSVERAMQWSKGDASDFIKAHKALAYKQLEAKRVGEEELEKIVDKWRGYDPVVEPEENHNLQAEVF